MRRFLAAKSNCAEGSASALLALLLVTSSPETASSDGLDPGAPADPSSRSSPTVIVYHQNSSTSEPACEIPQRTPAEISAARAYVVDTATPGYTMTLQGPELAVARLHPEFVVRLANAVREARNAGLRLRESSSAYRLPAFGVGGFRDKFNSLHTYGLAVDVYGIGRPGSTRRSSGTRSPRGTGWSVLTVRSTEPNESLPTDERQDRCGGQSFARDRNGRWPFRSWKYV